MKKKYVQVTKINKTHQYGTYIQCLHSSNDKLLPVGFAQPSPPASPLFNQPFIQAQIKENI